MKILKTIKEFFRKNKIKKQISKSKIINIWRNNTSNLGDLVCAPCLYFEELNQNAIKLDILDSGLLKGITEKIIILGGGGLFQRYFEKDIKKILELAENNNLYIWGAGLDNYIGEISKLPNFDNVKKIGLRDYDNSFSYVPCASCMSPLFDKYKKTQNKSKIKAYLHTDYSNAIVQSLINIPILLNKNNKDFETVIKFLSDSEFILTNSFHGLYWSTLLNKKVIVLPWVDKNGNIGFSQKFETFKYKPIFCQNWENYKEFLIHAKNYRHALEECRKLNKEFLRKYLNNNLRSKND